MLTIISNVEVCTKYQKSDLHKCPQYESEMFTQFDGRLANNVVYQQANSNKKINLLAKSLTHKLWCFKLFRNWVLSDKNEIAFETFFYSIFSLAELQRRQILFLAHFSLVFFPATWKFNYIEFNFHFHGESVEEWKCAMFHITLLV